MSLIKCKECKNEISKKAKKCPNCGSPVKRTSVVTLLVGLLFSVFIISSVMNSTRKASVNSSYVESGKSTNINKTKVVQVQQWKTHESKDKMTGELSAYANSRTVTASKKMDFPYSGVSSWMGVGCDANSEWVYFGFNQSPNLTKDETKDGYSLIKTRIKWNDSADTISLKQEWGAKSLHVINASDAISKILKSNTVLLELKWHGEQRTYFEYSLKGSTKAYNDIINRCRK